MWRFGLLVAAGILAGAAEVGFDDSVAMQYCNVPERPPDPVASVCMEIQSVGDWYMSELHALGIKPDVRVEPGHPQYDDVRKVGMLSDLRVQELQVSLVELAGDKVKLKRMKKTLEIMQANTNHAPLVDEIMKRSGIPDHGQSPSELMEMLQKAQESGISLEELMAQEEEEKSKQDKKKRKGKKAKRGKAQDSETTSPPDL